MQVPSDALQELTSKDDSGGVIGVRWTLSSPSTSVDKDRRTIRGGNVTLLDYLYDFLMQTYSDCSLAFLIMIHSPGIVAITVLLHQDPCYLCTI